MHWDPQYFVHLVGRAVVSRVVWAMPVTVPIVLVLLWLAVMALVFLGGRRHR